MDTPQTAQERAMSIIRRAQVRDREARCAQMQAKRGRRGVENRFGRLVTG